MDTVWEQAVSASRRRWRPSDQMRTDRDPDLIEIDSRGLPADALEWADTAVSEVVHQPVERNCATVGV